jgi:hypothetical protein
MTSLKKTPAATAAGQVDLTGLVAHTGVNMRHGATLQQITGNGVKENGHAEERQAQFVRPWVNPTQLARPSYLLNFPFSYATGFANNLWMEDLSPDRRQPDFRLAAFQFHDDDRRRLLRRHPHGVAGAARLVVIAYHVAGGLDDLLRVDEVRHMEEA